MVYLIGSLRNPAIPGIQRKLEDAGLSTFASWFAAGENADDRWQAYEQGQGFSYIEALQRPAAQNVFTFDLRHLKEAKAAVLIAPGGKSAHLELGWALGQGKPGYILLDKEPERWDVMAAFATGIYDTVEGLVKELQRVQKRRWRA